MKTPIRCLLLDDEMPGLAYLKMVCGELEGVEVVKAFNNPRLLLEEAAQLDFDLCILDIEMPGMSGLEVAALLMDKQVIFTTAYKEYASDAFDLHAVDYVRKPIQKERLQQAIEKAAKLIRTEAHSPGFITLNTDKGKSLLHFDRMFHIKASDIDSRDKNLLMNDGTVITLKNISFDKLLEILPPQQFVRVNKKEIIALRYVQSYTSSEIMMKDASGKTLNVLLSDLYRAGLLSRISR